MARQGFTVNRLWIVGLFFIPWEWGNKVAELTIHEVEVRCAQLDLDQSDPSRKIVLRRKNSQIPATVILLFFLRFLGLEAARRLRPLSFKDRRCEALRSGNLRSPAGELKQPRTFTWVVGLAAYHPSPFSRVTLIFAT